MILTKQKILLEMKSKRLRISPCERTSIGPASIDLTLGREFRVFDESASVIEISENIDYKEFTTLIKINKGFLLKPGQLILGVTKEKVTLPRNICGWLQSRSRFARVGLMSHVSAPFINPDSSSCPVLEIYNASHHNILLKPGIKICQLILQECIGSTKYHGKFKRQKL